MMRAMLRHPLRFTTDHRFVCTHASAFLDEELDAAQRTRVERHRQVCPKCARLLATLSRTVAGLRGLREERSPAGGVAEDVIARLRADADEPPAPGRPG